MLLQRVLRHRLLQTAKEGGVILGTVSPSMGRTARPIGAIRLPAIAEHLLKLLAEHLQTDLDGTGRQDIVDPVLQANIGLNVEAIWRSLRRWQVDVLKDVVLEVLVQFGEERLLPVVGAEVA